MRNQRDSWHVCPFNDEQASKLGEQLQGSYTPLWSEREVATSGTLSLSLPADSVRVLLRVQSHQRRITYGVC